MSPSEIIPLAFVMGVVGSLHCLGMCGPIAMALPMGNRTTAGRLYGGILYNFGRVLTYTWIGLVLGLTGGFLTTPGVQSSISIFFGAAILLYLLLPSGLKTTVGKKTPGFLLALRRQLGKLLSTQTNSSYFGIGLLNGLLPCGMIYLALASSFLAGGILKGGLFMLSFGAGTFPAMLAAVFFGSFINQQVRLKLRKAVPVFLACMAALLVLRGLNLGIPYLSPSLPQDTAAVETTCH
ncbi:sulfite exporter TauE/SafE family protein [Flavisolibacter nicotianae]|uniref:sulfite exporter TauE/SafE family protein n=1 Tax=Flavisolibacter nicotianae TaxID=2364882 RepID=UPI000EB519E7|nr:sulfite exporter TauE/SafE family protein [Flavisolibacter nicotianae]